MKKPIEMQQSYSIELHNGGVSTTLDVLEMLTASADGNFDRVKQLVAKNPGLLTCQFDYTTPMHLAVREGHFELVRYFIENRAFDPDEYFHPFMDTLIEASADRGYIEIVEFLQTTAADGSLTVKLPDIGKVGWRKPQSQIEFERAVDQGENDTVRRMLDEDPNAALVEDAFWGEGIMATAANGGDIKMLEILLSHGATVPTLSKWGARYYFKHYESGKFLLENGMDPNHMNWREFTLLHDMAHKGFVEKVELLMDHGAYIDAIDDEFSTTPLGYAAKWGNREVAILLLERGADPNKAGANWATPLAWAMRKGHAEIVADLRDHGAGGRS